MPGLDAWVPPRRVVIEQTLRSQGWTFAVNISRSTILLTLSHTPTPGRVSHKLQCITSWVTMGEDKLCYLISYWLSWPQTLSAATYSLQGWIYSEKPKLAALGISSCFLFLVIQVWTSRVASGYHCNPSYSRWNIWFLHHQGSFHFQK